MWNRINIKNDGKARFKANYWMCVLVSFILAACIGGFAVKSLLDGENTISPDRLLKLEFDIWDGIKAFGSFAVGGAGIFSIAFNLLIRNPFQVGACRFFSENRIKDDAQFGAVKAGFPKQFGNIVLTRFLESLYIALLSLLFIIPGIVRALGYFAVPYILAENPSLDHKRVLRLSREMTKGYKGNIFGMGLSFIGWFILSALTAEILGIFYVNPYYDAAKAEMYSVLRENALANGIADINELPGFGEPSDEGFAGGETQQADYNYKMVDPEEKSED